MEGEIKGVLDRNSSLFKLRSFAVQFSQPIAFPNNFLNGEISTDKTDRARTINPQSFRSQFYYLSLNSDSTNDLNFLNRGTKIHFSHLHFGNLIQIQLTKKGLFIYSYFGRW